MINTVTGKIKKDKLGVILAHEHVCWNSDKAQYLYFDKMYDEKGIQNLEKMYDSLLPVFKKLYQQGCCAVAETSPPYGGQNLKLMQKLSEDSGVKIIPNTGLAFSRHVYQIHKDDFAKQVARRWIKDFEEGLDTINDTIIRPSHIKLLLYDNEGLSEVDREKVRAAVLASKSTGLPIHCHIMGKETAEDVIDFLEEQNFEFKNFLWAHASHKTDEEWNKTLRRAISTGMWLGFDAIRVADGYRKFLDLIKEAIDKDYADRILLSQDYDFCEEVSKSSSDHPCVSLFTDFIPYCQENGLDRNIILDIMSKNPANFYNIEQVN
jgi:phosphotriesterase-related protein